MSAFVIPPSTAGGRCFSGCDSSDQGKSRGWARSGAVARRRFDGRLTAVVVAGLGAAGLAGGAARLGTVAHIAAAGLRRLCGFGVIGLLERARCRDRIVAAIFRRTGMVVARIFGRARTMALERSVVGALPTAGAALPAATGFDRVAGRVRRWSSRRPAPGAWAAFRGTEASRCAGGRSARGAHRSGRGPRPPSRRRSSWRQGRRSRLSRTLRTALLAGRAPARGSRGRRAASCARGSGAGERSARLRGARSRSPRSFAPRTLGARAPSAGARAAGRVRAARRAVARAPSRCRAAVGRRSAPPSAGRSPTRSYGGR